MREQDTINGTITYDVIEDEKILDRVKNIVHSDTITRGLSQIFGTRVLDDHRIADFWNQATVDEHGIAIDSVRPDSHLREEILMITQLLEYIGITGIHVDIERKGKDLDGDKCIERYKIEDDGFVTSDKEKIA